MCKRTTKRRTNMIGKLLGTERRKARTNANEDMRGKCIQVLRDAYLAGTISDDAFEFVSGNMRNIQ